MGTKINNQTTPEELIDRSWEWIMGALIAGLLAVVGESALILIIAVVFVLIGSIGLYIGYQDKKNDNA